MNAGLVIKTGHKRFFPHQILSSPQNYSLVRCQIIYTTEKKTAMNDEQTKPMAFSQ
jgi:hypothetical protein